MEIRRLDHAALLVKDVERSRRFYGQVLGNVEIVGGSRPRGDSLLQTYICDPDGYTVELFVWEK